MKVRMREKLNLVEEVCISKETGQVRWKYARKWRTRLPRVAALVPNSSNRPKIPVPHAALRKWEFDERPTYVSMFREGCLLHSLSNETTTTRTGHVLDPNRANRSNRADRPAPANALPHSDSVHSTPFAVFHSFDVSRFGHSEYVLPPLSSRFSKSLQNLAYEVPGRSEIYEPQNAGKEIASLKDSYLTKFRNTFPSTRNASNSKYFQTH